MKTVKLFLGILSFSVAGFSLPNPSFVFCVENEGVYEVRTREDGAQAGVCIFQTEDGVYECGGWAYFRGDCMPKECLIWSVDKNLCEVNAN